MAVATPPTLEANSRTSSVNERFLMPISNRFDIMRATGMDCQRLPPTSAHHTFFSIFLPDVIKHLRTPKLTLDVLPALGSNDGKISPRQSAIVTKMSIVL
jgi:hypothetical protein